jgi:transposase
MKPNSVDLRQKILQAYERGMGSQAKLAALFGVSISFVEKLFMRVRSTGQIAPRQRTGGIPSRIDAAARQQLQQWLAEQPDLTLAELAERLDQSLHIQVSLSRLCKVLKELGLPRKKSRSMPPSATASE